MGDFRSCGLCKVSVFVLPSAIAGHAPPTHPTVKHFQHVFNFKVEVKLLSSHFFVTIIIIIMSLTVNKGQAQPGCVDWLGMTPSGM